MNGPAIADRLRPTLGDPSWLAGNTSKLRGLLPVLWTRASEPEFLVRFALGMRMLGVNWLDNDDLLVAALWLCHIDLGEQLVCDQPLTLNRLWVRRKVRAAA